MLGWMPPTAPAPISLAPRVVVFDYGEVISREPTQADRDRLVARAGADDESFWPAYWSHREALDQGTATIAEYWSAVAEDLGVEWDAVDVHELWAIDHRGWLSVDPGTLRVLHALADGGTRLALLSNAGPDFSGWLRSGSFSPLFERVFVSGELGTGQARRGDLRARHRRARHHGHPSCCSSTTSPRTSRAPGPSAATATCSRMPRRSRPGSRGLAA